MKYFNEFNFSKNTKERKRHVQFSSAKDEFTYEAAPVGITLEDRIEALGKINNEKNFLSNRVTILTAASMNDYLLVQV